MENLLLKYNLCFEFMCGNLIQETKKKQPTVISNSIRFGSKKKFLQSSPSHTSVTNAPACELSLKAVFSMRMIR